VLAVLARHRDLGSDVSGSHGLSFFPRVAVAGLEPATQRL
jgi:hypothetical protein